MALPESEIIARNKENQKEIEELTEIMNKYNEEHKEEFAAAKAKTDAVLNGTSDKLVKNSNQPEVTTEILDITMSNQPVLVSPPLLFGGGFTIGVALTVIFFKFKIKQIKAECDTRVAESRATIDRMISVMSKD